MAAKRPTIWMEILPETLLSGDFDVEAFFGQDTYLEFNMNPKGNKVMENLSADDEARKITAKKEKDDENEMEHFTNGDLGDIMKKTDDGSGVKLEDQEYDYGPDDDITLEDYSLAKQEESDNEGVLGKQTSFCCDLCGQIFKRNENLTQHKTSCRNGITHDCNLCEKQFDKQKELTKHNQKEHDRDWICCDQCDKRFGEKGNLWNHINSIHSNVSHRCEFCEYKSNRIGNLDLHMKTMHKDIVDFCCTECDFKAGNPSHLAAHMKKNHK